jgi:hypothetical protein
MDLKPITKEQIKVLEDAANAARSGRASTLSIYPEPSVRPVNGFGVLQPDVTGVDNVQIVVDYDGMPNTDVLSFYWNGDTTSIAPVQADTRPKLVSVPAALVIAAAGNTINVIYSVTDDANPGGVPSDPHSQVVERYTPPVYPKPVITEAVDGVLDVSKLTANARMTLAAWPGQAVGQKLWLTVTSTPPIEIENWNPLNVTTLGAQARQFSLEKLKTLTDGSTFKLTLQYSPVGSNDKLPFSEASYTIKQEPTAIGIAITSVKDSKGVEIPNGGTTTDTSVTVAGTVTFAA